jgi:NAD(P)-dependent dehydrogenase (short-subunit alcohol dehydrogenase family)
MSEFQDKKVMVTGAANGIGRAIALRFAGLGAHIIAIDQDGAELAALVKELGKQVSGAQMDCTDRVAVQNGIAAIEREHPCIDVLVNNVGQSPRERAAFFHESNPDVWDFVLGVCLLAMMNVSRQVVGGMRTRKAGKIVNISSQAAFSSEKMLSDYCAAKAGVLGFTRALATELAPYGINVNAVCPGVTRTRAVAANPQSVIRHALDATPSGIMTEPEDIANAVLFLSSEQSRCIVGQSIIVDGGRVMK